MFDTMFRKRRLTFVASSPKPMDAPVSHEKNMRQILNDEHCATYLISCLHNIPGHGKQQKSEKLSELRGPRET